jgi:glycosyltransferase involved in cell wall biosynthesis
MRICLVNLRAAPLYFPGLPDVFGGAEVEGYHLAALFRELGHDVHVLVRRMPVPDGSLADGARLHALGGDSPWASRLALWRALGRIQPDLVFTKLIHDLNAQAGLWARLHGRGLLYRAANRRDLELAQGSRAHGWKDPWYFRALCQGRSVVVAQNPEQEEAFVHRLGRESVLCMPNYQRPSGRPLPFAEREGVLWVGHLTPVKRPELAVELAGRLPEIPFTLVASTQDSPLLAEQEALLAGQANIRYLRNLPYHETQALFERHRLLLNTSRSEGFPNTFLQAMGAGMPLATTGLDPGGLIAAGLGVAEVEPARLAARVRQLHDDPSTWELYHGRVLRQQTTQFDPAHFRKFYGEALALAYGRAQGRGSRVPTKTGESPR